MGQYWKNVKESLKENWWRTAKNVSVVGIFKSFQTNFSELDASYDKKTFNVFLKNMKTLWTNLKKILEHFEERKKNRKYFNVLRYIFVYFRKRSCRTKCKLQQIFEKFLKNF